MNTLGNRIFKIQPVHSFDSQFASGVSIGFSTIFGAPVSSNHIIATSIIGVGAAENPKKVNWITGRDIVIAMIVTIPVTIIISWTAYHLIGYIPGV